MNRAAENRLGYFSKELAGKENLTILYDEDEIIQRAQELSEEFGGAEDTVLEQIIFSQGVEKFLLGDLFYFGKPLFIHDHNRKR